MDQMKKLDREKLDWPFRQAIANMELEGLYPTDTEIMLVDRWDRGEITLDELVRLVLENGGA